MVRMGFPRGDSSVSRALRMLNCSTKKLFKRIKAKFRKAFCIFKGAVSALYGHTFEPHGR